MIIIPFKGKEQEDKTPALPSINSSTPQGIIPFAQQPKATTTPNVTTPKATTPKTGTTKTNKNKALGIIGRALVNTPASIGKGVTSAIDNITDLDESIGNWIAQSRLKKNPTNATYQRAADIAANNYQKARDTHALGDAVKEWEQKVDERQQAIMEDNPNSKLAEIAYKGTELMESAGRMLPGLAVGAATGGLGSVAQGASFAAGMSSGLGEAAGLATMWADVYSQSMKESTEQGYDVTQSGWKAFGDATLEVATEMLSGGIAGLGEGVIGSKWAKEFLENTGEQAIKHVGLKSAGIGLATAIAGIEELSKSEGLIGLLVRGAGEGVEEMISEAMSPVIERWTTNPEATNATFPQIIEAGIGGMALSFIMAPVGKVSQNWTARIEEKGRINFIEGDAQAQLMVAKGLVNSDATTGAALQVAEKKLGQELAQRKTEEVKNILGKVKSVERTSKFYTGLSNEVNIELANRIIEKCEQAGSTSLALDEMWKDLSSVFAIDTQMKIQETVLGKSVDKGFDEFLGRSKRYAAAQKSYEDSRYRYNDAVKTGNDARAARAKFEMDTNSARMEAAKNAARETYAKHKAAKEALEDSAMNAILAAPRDVNQISRFVAKDSNGSYQIYTRAEYYDQLAQTSYGTEYSSLDDKQKKDVQKQARNDFIKEKTEAIAATRKFIGEINQSLSDAGLDMKVVLTTNDQNQRANYGNGVITMSPDVVYTRGAAEYYLSHELLHGIIDKFMSQELTTKFYGHVADAMRAIGFDYDALYTALRNNKTYNAQWNQNIKNKKIDQNEAKHYKDKMAQEEATARFISAAFSSEGLLQALASYDSNLVAVLGEQLEQSSVRNYSENAWNLARQEILATLNDAIENPASPDTVKEEVKAAETKAMSMLVEEDEQEDAPIPENSAIANLSMATSYTVDTYGSEKEAERKLKALYSTETTNPDRHNFLLGMRYGIGSFTKDLAQKATYFKEQGALYRLNTSLQSVISSINRRYANDRNLKSNWEDFLYKEVVPQVAVALNDSIKTEYGEELDLAYEIEDAIQNGVREGLKAVKVENAPDPIDLYADVCDAVIDALREQEERSGKQRRSEADRETTERYREKITGLCSRLPVPNWIRRNSGDARVDYSSPSGKAIKDLLEDYNVPWTLLTDAEYKYMYGKSPNRILGLQTLGLIALTPYGYSIGNVDIDNLKGIILHERTHLMYDAMDPRYMRFIDTCVSNPELIFDTDSMAYKALYCYYYDYVLKKSKSVSKSFSEYFAGGLTEEKINTYYNNAKAKLKSPLLKWAEASIYDELAAYMVSTYVEDGQLYLEHTLAKAFKDEDVYRLPKMILDYWLPTSTAHTIGSDITGDTKYRGWTEDVLDPDTGEVVDAAHQTTFTLDDILDKYANNPNAYFQIARGGRTIEVVLYKTYSDSKYSSYDTKVFIAANSPAFAQSPMAKLSAEDVPYNSDLAAPYNMNGKFGKGTGLDLLDPEIQRQVNDLQDKYGTKEGRTPRTEEEQKRTAKDRQGVLPEKVNDHLVVGDTFENIYTDTNTSKEFASEMIEASVKEGIGTHLVDSDEAAMAYAYDQMSKFVDLSAAYQYVRNILKDEQGVSKDGKFKFKRSSLNKNTLVLGEQVLNEMNNEISRRIEAGEEYHELAAATMELVADLCATATRAGQVLQAFSLLKKMTPQGRLYYINAQINNFITDMVDRRGNVRIPGFKWIEDEHGNIVSNMISEELKQRMLACTSEEEMRAVEEEIIAEVAAKFPPKLTERIVAWRYLAMLGNPRTHIRNMSSNLVMGQAVKLKDFIAGGIEDFLAAQGKISSGGRQKSNRAVRELSREAKTAIKDFANEDWINERDVAMDGGHIGYRDMINDARNKLGFTIGGKEFNFLDDVNRKNNEWLEAEDDMAGKSAFVHALTQYIATNYKSWGCNESNVVDFLKSGTMEANVALAQARKYAVNEAAKATYHDANEVATALNNLEKKMGTMGKLIIGGMMPFKKTPMNILKRGLEYSPVGLLKGIKSIIETLNTEVSDYKGTYSAIGAEDSLNEKKADLRLTAESKRNAAVATAVDQLASGMTGTMAMLLGYFLAQIGMMKGGGNENDREEYYDQMLGEQKYSITIGGKNYTLDWMTPMSMPLFVGVELHDAFSGELDLSFTEAMSIISKLADPVTNLSVLQGFSEAMSSYNKGLGGVLLSAAESYAGQFIPTASGQLARIFDDTRRTTYAPKDAKAGKELQTFINRMKNKIPGLSQTNAEYVDMWGRTENNTGAFGSTNIIDRILGQAVVPWYERNLDKTEADDHVSTLFQATGDRTVIPTSPTSSFTFDNQDYYLTAEEYTQVKKLVGQLSYEGVNSLFEQEGFLKLTAEEQAALVSKVYSYARAVAKSDYAEANNIAYKPESYVTRISKAVEAGMSIGQALYIYTVANQFTADKNAKGNSISGSKKKKVLAYYDFMGLTDAQKKAISIY